MKPSPVKAMNEEGSVLVVALLILVIVTLMGVFASQNAQVELQIAGNEETGTLAFYSAEAARGYVERTPGLWGTDNISEGVEISFPNQNYPDRRFAMNAKQKFNGVVGYDGFSSPPRGSGYQVGAFRAHRYEMTCNGYAPGNIVCRIDAGFYRIGF